MYSAANICKVMDKDEVNDQFLRLSEVLECSIQWNLLILI